MSVLAQEYKCHTFIPCLLKTPKTQKKPSTKKFEVCLAALKSAQKLKVPKIKRFQQTSDTVNEV